jgi:hypothetical protein
MPVAKVIWDGSMFDAWVKDSAASPQRALYYAAVRVTVAMKAMAPVSKVANVYATGGATVPGGSRFAGDFPLRPSGYLRKSIVRVKEPGTGDWLIGPTAPYADYVNSGTGPHIINSTGPWSLRSRVTGAYFGRTVHHPGTRAVHFVERSLSAISGASVHVI